jgi:hypothetical protein
MKLPTYVINIENLMLKCSDIINRKIFLISKFRCVLNVVLFILGNSPASVLNADVSEQSVPKRRHLKLRRRGITQKK